MSRASGYPPEGVVAWRSSWAEDYSRISAGLGAALGPGWRFEHVGSTSVPGLAAKPVIDIAARVPEDITIASADTDFRMIGWSDVVGVGDHAATVLSSDGVRGAVTHLFTAEQWPGAHVRLFAEWLRHDATDRRRYAALKRRLVADGIWGTQYTAATSQFVREVVDRARAARGLPPSAEP